MDIDNIEEDIGDFENDEAKVSSSKGVKTRDYFSDISNDSDNDLCKNVGEFHDTEVSCIRDENVLTVVQNSNSVILI